MSSTLAEIHRSIGSVAIAALVDAEALRSQVRKRVDEEAVSLL